MILDSATCMEFANYLWTRVIKNISIQLKLQQKWGVFKLIIEFVKSSKNWDL